MNITDQRLHAALRGESADLTDVLARVTSLEAGQVSLAHAFAALTARLDATLASEPAVTVEHVPARKKTRGKAR